MIAAVAAWLRDLPVRLRRITSGAAYRPEVDGLRFFAIAIVIVGHLSQRVDRMFTGHSAPHGLEKWAYMNFLRHPSLGVTLFFSISGFIIASQFMRRPANALSAAFLKPYFARRVTRIEPPYMILLVATFAFLTLSGYVPPDTHKFFTKPASLTVSFIASLLYSHGWLFGTYPRLFVPGWSLEIEVQFYVLAPLMFFLYLRVRQPLRRLGAGFAVLAASAAVSVWSEQPSPIKDNLYFTLVYHLPYFWLGILASDVNVNFKPELEKARALLGPAVGWISLALFLLTAPAVDSTHPPVQIAMRVGQLVGMSGMFVGALTENGFRRFCARPWISLIGGACYSLYLTHMQFMQIATHVLSRFYHPHSFALALIGCMAIEIPFVIAVGLTAYAFVERPFMVPGWPKLVSGWVRRRVLPAD